MKTYILISSLIISLVLLLTVNATAQQRGGQQGPGMQISLLYADGINLTEAQKNDIAKLMVEHRQSMREMRSEMGRGNRMERREQRADSRQDVSAQIKNILTPAQFATFEARQKEMAENRAEVQTYMLRAQADAISDEVGLSAAKKTAVMQAVNNHIEKTAPFRQNRTRGERPDIDTRIERLEAQRAFRTEVATILSEQELEAWMAEWSKMHPGIDGNRVQRNQRGQNERGNNRQRGQNR